MRGITSANMALRALILCAAMGLGAPVGAQQSPLQELEPITLPQPETGANTGGTLGTTNGVPKGGQTGANIGGSIGGQTGVTTFADGDMAGAQRSDPSAAATTEVDFAAWENDAARVEAALEEATTSDVTMELLRAQLVDWRARFLVAQSGNSARIDTLRQQIAALGPLPAEGETEAAEIVTRRTELNEQLSRLQVPGLAADEAYRRADGLIREIDRTLRERQADALLKLLPSPLNPTNWPDAARAVTGAIAGIGQEIQVNLAKPNGRDALLDNLPGILLLLMIALGLIWRGRQMVERFVGRIASRTGLRGARVSALLLSLGQILIPMIGVVALSHALRLTGLFGIVGSVVVQTLPSIGFLVLAAYWLGGRVFPREGGFLPLTLSPDRRAEGRFLSAVYGMILGLDALRFAALDVQALSEAALSVLAFPTLLLAGGVLWRMGGLLRLHAQSAEATVDDTGFRGRLIGLVARGALIIGVVGPLLAAVGYISAAGAMIFPAATSLGVIGLLFVLQVVVTDVYALVTRSEDGAQQALVPVLVGFALVLASVPLFALIWGARLVDLTEVWTRVREGFSLGDTQISPTNFLVFAAIFTFGFTLTRLFQGALKGSILPRTQMDQGARNAIVSGVGYTGIFFAALIAINSAGIDLSGLAIVAGALSVGIGFGLQNIVSNFVSGIILLIERPVSEGDWIEVGGVQGTVRSISVRSTRIQTFDRTDVIVPNTDLVAGQVTNWTRFNLTGRLIVPVGVAFGTDTRLVERVLQEIAEAQPLAVLNPPPMIAFMGFGADSMNFEIRVILRDVNFSLAVRTEINHQIVARFKQAGIEIPFAQSEITLRNAPEIADMLRGTASAAPKPGAGNRASRPTGAPKRDHVPGEGLSPQTAPGPGQSDPSSDLDEKA